MPVTKGSGNSGSSGLVDRNGELQTILCASLKRCPLCRSASVNVCVLSLMLGKRSLLTHVLLNEADTSVVVSKQPFLRNNLAALQEQLTVLMWL